MAVQPVDPHVVVIEDVRPVVDELLLCIIMQDFLRPALFRQNFDQCGLKIRFFRECHGAPSSQLNEHFLQAGFLDILQPFQLTLMKGDKVVEVTKESSYLLLFIPFCGI